MVHLKDTIFRLTVYIFTNTIVYFKTPSNLMNLTLIPQFSSSYPVANYSNYSFSLLRLSFDFELFTLFSSLVD